MPCGVLRNISRCLRRFFVLSIPLPAVLAETVRYGPARASLCAEGPRRGYRGGVPQTSALRPARGNQERIVSERGGFSRPVSGASGTVPVQDRGSDL